MISKRILKQRFCNAASTYSENAVVQAKMATELVELAKPFLLQEQKSMLELGCGTGLLTKKILSEFKAEKYIANDIVNFSEEYVSDIVKQYSSELSFIAGDIEYLNFPKGQNVIWSGATIQWIQHIESFFQKMGDVLEQEGTLIISTFGPNNYSEIRSITGEGIDYPKLEELLEKATPYFDVVETKEWQEKLMFNSPVEVLRHMQATGVNSVSEKRWTKGDLEYFKLKYESFKKEKKYPLTYHPYLMVLVRKNADLAKEEKDETCVHIELLKKRIDGLE